MRNQKGYITALMYLFLIIPMMVGCGTEDEYEKMEEELISLEFISDGDGFFTNHTATIKTDSRTFVWSIPHVSFVAAEDGTNTIAYHREKDGQIRDKKIYLTPSGLKEYSETYANTYGSSLKLTQE